MVTHSRANLALTLTKLVLRTKNMTNELLYGLEVFLEVFLGVYEMSWDSINLKIAGVRRIYRPPTQESRY